MFPAHAIRIDKIINVSSVKKNNNLRLVKFYIILLAQLVNVCSRISAYNYTTTAQADTAATHTLCNYSHHITSQVLHELLTYR